MKRMVGIGLVIGIGLSSSTGVLAAWEDWWQTPEQRAAEAFKQGDAERLLEQAPDADWRGLGHYQAGDFDTAAEVFGERAEQLQQQGDARAANRARYNQGVSDVRAGRYQQAVEQFDAVLESDPGFADAAHNRDIAERLQQLQQQQQQQSQDGEGEQGEQDGEGEQGDQADQGDADSQGSQSGQDSPDQSGDAESGQEPGQNSSADSPADDESGQRGESTDDDASPSAAQDSGSAAAESEAERQEAVEAAQRALDAEAQQSDAESDEAGAAGDAVPERPLSESEQATEQLLRRIPDDPAGLLRRRLEQSHRIEYPEVRDGREAW